MMPGIVCARLGLPQREQGRTLWSSNWESSNGPGSTACPTVLTEEICRPVGGRLRSQRASQGGIVDAICAKDVEQIAVKLLDLAEGLRISPSEMLTEQ